MPEREPIGGLLDALGVRHTPQPGELIAGAAVLLKVVDKDGRVTMRHAWSDGMSWVERIGLYQVALSMEQAELTQVNLRMRDED